MPHKIPLVIIDAPFLSLATFQIILSHMTVSIHYTTHYFVNLCYLVLLNVYINRIKYIPTFNKLSLSYLFLL